MKMLKWLWAALALAVASAPAARAQTTNLPQISLTVNTAYLGITIPTYFVGVSFEIGNLTGITPLVINNAPMNAILSVLGGNCTFRIGGTTSDEVTPPLAAYTAGVATGNAICGSNYQIWGQAWTPISPNATAAQQGATDASQVSTLLASSGAPTIYNIIGNEPNLYNGLTETFAAWQTGWQTIQPLITASNAGALYGGPELGLAPNIAPTWWSQYAVGMGSLSSIMTIHCYGPYETGNLLADLNYAFYFNDCAPLARGLPLNPAAAALGVKFIVDESGDFLHKSPYTEGNTLGGALYDLDNMIIFAENGWNSMNFHGSPALASYGPPPYSPIATSDGVTYRAQATLYAMLAFQQIAGGQIAQLTGIKDGAAIAVVKGGNTVILFLNEDFTDAVQLDIASITSISTANVEFLAAPNYGSSAVTLGGATVSSTGAFSPTTQSLTVTGKQVTTTVCGGCAAIVTLH